MAGLYFISIFLAFIYIFIITHFLTAWNEIEEWETSESFKPETKISVIIPFRNEEENILNCIKSISSNYYPKTLLEIIAVDDNSEDRSSEILRTTFPQIKILKLADLPGNRESKKEAIKAGISVAGGDLIVTIDADCIAPKYWLRNISSHYEYTGKSLIVGFVKVTGKKSNLEYFQVMDTCGTMGLHAAGIHNKTHFLANGANFIYKKSLFELLDPFEDNKDFASGDDVFFINKVAELDSELIACLKCKDAVVETKAETSWIDLWNQRKRWAGKNKAYSKGLYKVITGVIWVFCLSIILNILLIPFSAGFSFFIVLSQLFIKGVMDYLYLKNMCKYFDKSESLTRFFQGLFLHTAYIVLGGFFAIAGTRFLWKGRELS